MKFLFLFLAELGIWRKSFFLSSI